MPSNKVLQTAATRLLQHNLVVETTVTTVKADNGIKVEERGDVNIIEYKEHGAEDSVNFVVTDKTVEEEIDHAVTRLYTGS
jgi:hypothetical protein